jgi:hypothetical protein
VRYGNVRQTDREMVGHIVDGLVARVCIALPAACASLDDDAAAAIFQRILSTNAAVLLLQSPEQIAMWQQTLAQMAGRDNLQGLIAGRCCRILLDAGLLDSAGAGQHMRLALSSASEPVHAAPGWRGLSQGQRPGSDHDDSL